MRGDELRACEIIWNPRIIDRSLSLSALSVDMLVQLLPMG
jgi:hypothetical protein